MTTLADGQYAYRGFTFGRATDYPLSLPQIEGLEGAEASVGDQVLPRGHGSVPGKHFVIARQMAAPFVIARDTRAELEEAQRALADLFAVDVDDNHDLEFKKPGQPQRLVRCRPTRFNRGDTRLGLQAAPAAALIAADPRIYSAEEHTQIIPLYTPGGGAIDLPIVQYPIDFPAGVTLEAALVNAGNADAYPTFRFFGPAAGTVTGVTVTNMTTGEELEITASIAAGQILTFDGTAFVTGSGGLVVALDGSSRYGDWEQPRVPLALPPGESVLRFTTTGTATVVACVATWRDTWLN